MRANWLLYIISCMENLIRPHSGPLICFWVLCPYPDPTHCWITFLNLCRRYISWSICLDQATVLFITPIGTAKTSLKGVCHVCLVSGITPTCVSILLEIVCACSLVVCNVVCCSLVVCDIVYHTVLMFSKCRWLQILICCKVNWCMWSTSSFSCVSFVRLQREWYLSWTLLYQSLYMQGFCCSDSRPVSDK